MKIYSETNAILIALGILNGYAVQKLINHVVISLVFSFHVGRVEWCVIFGFWHIISRFLAQKMNVLESIMEKESQSEHLQKEKYSSIIGGGLMGIK